MQAHMEADAKWALYDVLARLTFDGRIARSETVDFLARIERDNLIDDGDMAWWGWEHAVERLGLVEFEPALRRVWKKPVYDHHNERDLAEFVDELRATAERSDNPAPFDKVDIRPITDPVESMEWIERRAESMAKWHAKQQLVAAPPADSDVAKAERLTEDEHHWLTGLLVSRQVPETTMPFEALDGFMTALVIGPATVTPHEWLPEVWGTEHPGGNSQWDTVEQANHALALLMKHWNAIAARRMADAPHAPQIETFGIPRPGEEWAQGFLDGIEMRAAAWELFFLDRKTDRLFTTIELLAGEMGGADAHPSRETRDALIERLPETLRRIAAYWRDPASAFPRQAPKVGRNEACPCGSGKKFKKCCGSGSGPTVH